MIAYHSLDFVALCAGGAGLFVFILLLIWMEARP